MNSSHRHILQFTATILVIFLGANSLTAQWFSAEAFRLDGIIMRNELNESTNLTRYTQEINGLDTTFLSNQFVGNEQGTHRISTMSAGGIIRLHLPLKEKITFSTGLGISVQNIFYRRNTSLTDTILVSSNEIESLSLDDFNAVLQPFPFICDDFNGFILGGNFSIREPRTFYTLINLSIPFNLQYQLVEDRLDLRGGISINIPIYNSIRYLETHTRNFNFDTEESVRCGLVDARTEISGSNLASLSLAGSLGLDFKIKGRVRTNFSLVKNLTSINKAVTTDRMELPLRYRPISIQAGISIDHIKKENIEKKKTNYMLGRRE